MASLQEIRDRIGTISTTRKITRAMELVATSKLQRTRKNLQKIQDYCTSVRDVFKIIIRGNENFEQLFNSKQRKNATYYIVITSDLGLCGAFNANIIRLLKNELKPDDKITVIGNQGVKTVLGMSLKPSQVFNNFGDELDYKKLSEIARRALIFFNHAEVKAIKIIYTKFINTITHEAKSEQVFPLLDEEFKSITTKQTKKIDSLIEFEPSSMEVTEAFLPLYLSSILFNAWAESKVAEMSSRRTAMESASDNASELIDELNLEYNRIRQAKITQEISEIVAGAEGE